MLDHEIRHEAIGSWKTGKRLFSLVFGTHKVSPSGVADIVVSSLAMVEATLFLRTWWMGSSSRWSKVQRAFLGMPWR
jgi:hypothetical protein